MSNTDSSPARLDAPGGEPPERRRAPTIRDFLTDGSVAGLCDLLSRLTGAPTWLRDESGEVVVPATGDRPWALVPEDEGVDRAFALVGSARQPEVRIDEVPLVISSGPIGALMTCPGVAGEPDEASILRAVRLLGSAVCDVCEAQVALHRRVRELDALYRLSSLQVRADDLGELFDTALSLALGVLEADAGLIGLLRDDGSVEFKSASRAGESQQITDRAESLFEQGAPGRASLSGETVIIDSIGPGADGADPIGMLSVGMLYRGRSLGVLALLMRPARSFSAADVELVQSIADHVASALNDAQMRRLREDAEHIQRQVHLAAQVQRQMLPRRTPRTAGLDIAARYEPSFELGGDFYDLLELGSSLGVAVGDVVGKGVPAAMLMSAVRASLRAHAQDVYDLREVLRRVNRALSDDTQDHEFATLFYGVIEPSAQRLTYVTAGHEPALLIRRGATRADQVQELHSGGMIIGIDPTQRFEPRTLGLRPADTLVIFTDGLPDTTDFDQQRFTKARLKRILAEFVHEQPDAGAADVLEHIAWHIRQFAGLSRRIDDITIVVIRVGDG